MSTSYFLLLFFLAAVASVSSELCTYTVQVKTGTVSKAGTNSQISVILKDSADPQGSRINIPDIEVYGKMGSKHDYFEKGNLDIFEIETTCLESRVCFLTLSSDNKGASSGWYVDYVQVLETKGSTKAPGDNIVFNIYGWLAKDEPPFLLTRDFNQCGPAMLINSII